MRPTRLVMGLAAAALSLGMASVAVAPAEKAAPRTEQEDAQKLERKVDRLRRRLRDPERTGSREMRRRLRQIRRGSLGAANGLKLEG